jgi:hypothetical protein
MWCSPQVQRQHKDNTERQGTVASHYLARKEIHAVVMRFIEGKAFNSFTSVN